MKKMKKLKKLSLENEMKKEAEQIEKKVREDRSLDDITVSDEMEKELFNKIQDYEYDKRHKKSHPQKEEKQACNRSTGSSADSGVRKCDDQCGE